MIDELLYLLFSSQYQMMLLVISKTFVVYILRTTSIYLLTMTFKVQYCILYMD